MIMNIPVWFTAALIVMLKSIIFLVHGVLIFSHAALLTDVTSLGRSFPLKRANLVSFPGDKSSPISKYSSEPWKVKL